MNQDTDRNSDQTIEVVDFVVTVARRKYPAGSDPNGYDGKTQVLYNQVLPFDPAYHVAKVVNERALGAPQEKSES